LQGSVKGVTLNEKYLQGNNALKKKKKKKKEENKKIEVSLYNEMLPGIQRGSVIIKVDNHIQ